MEEHKSEYDSFPVVFWLVVLVLLTFFDIKGLIGHAEPLQTGGYGPVHIYAEPQSNTRPGCPERVMN